MVNQTRAEVCLSRQHLVAVEQFAKELYAELVIYRRVLDGFVGSLIALEESTQIDQILSALESVHNLWLRESDRYQRQRASLELGQLTEEILPPNELLLILCVFAMVEVSSSPIVETLPWSPEGGSQTSFAYDSWRLLDRHNVPRWGGWPSVVNKLM